MKPTLALPVIVRGPQCNGTIDHPGVVTRVWTDTCVNATCFPDAASTPIPFTSVEFRQSRAAGEEYLASQLPASNPRVCFPVAE